MLDSTHCNGDRLSAQYIRCCFETAVGDGGRGGTGAHFLAQAGLELETVSLLQLLESWDYKARATKSGSQPELCGNQFTS